MTLAKKRSIAIVVTFTLLYVGISEYRRYRAHQELVQVSDQSINFADDGTEVPREWISRANDVGSPLNGNSDKLLAQKFVKAAGHQCTAVKEIKPFDGSSLVTCADDQRYLLGNTSVDGKQRPIVIWCSALERMGAKERC